MPVLYKFERPSFTTSQYDEIIKLLEEAGWGAPEGRRYHVCYGQPGKLRVIQVWDSEQQLRAYYQALYPILLKVGVAPVEPYLEDVYHILEGIQHR